MFGRLRALITKHMGDPVLRLIRDNQKDLGLDPDVFDMVYEGFWDLYTLKDSKVDNVTNKQLMGWIGRFNLNTVAEEGGAPADGGEAAAAEEAAEDGAAEEAKDAVADTVSEVDPTPEIAAVVRVRIPKKQPEPELDEEGTPVEPEEPIDQAKLDEIDFEDKAFTVAVNVGG